MATGDGRQRDVSKGRTNQPGNEGAGSPRIQGTWSRKDNKGGTAHDGMAKVNSKRITVK